MAKDVQIKRKTKNPNYVGDLLHKFKTVPEVAVGFPASLRNNSAAKELNGASVVDVAIWNNFGTKTIPERRFMEASSHRIGSELESVRQKYLKAVVEGQMDLELALERLGARAANVIRKTINDWTDPPNSPLTIEGGWITTPSGQRVYIDGKKANNPLVNTGLMRNMVAWELRKKQ